MRSAASTKRTMAAELSVVGSIAVHHKVVAGGLKAKRGRTIPASLPFYFEQIVNAVVDQRLGLSSNAMSADKSFCISSGVADG